MLADFYGQTSIEPFRHPFPDLAKVTTGVLLVRINVTLSDASIVASWNWCHVNSTLKHLPQGVNTVVW